TRAHIHMTHALATATMLRTLAQSPSVVHAVPDTPPNVTAVGKPLFPSVTVQLCRSAPPSSATRYRTFTLSAATVSWLFQLRHTSPCPSSSAVTSPTSWKVAPPSHETSLSTAAKHDVANRLVLLKNESALRLLKLQSVLLAHV